MNTRHALSMGAIALGFGMALAFGAGTASADDGTGAVAPGPASTETTAVADDAPPVNPAKATGIKGQSKFGSDPTAGLGNGRSIGDFGSAGGIGSGLSTASAANQAEAKEIEQSMKYLEDQGNEEEFVADMLETMEDVKSQLANMPVVERQQRILP